MNKALATARFATQCDSYTIIDALPLAAHGGNNLSLYDMSSHASMLVDSFTLGCRMRSDHRDPCVTGLSSLEDVTRALHAGQSSCLTACSSSLGSYTEDCEDDSGRSLAEYYGLRRESAESDCEKVLFRSTTHFKNIVKTVEKKFRKICNEPHGVCILGQWDISKEECEEAAETLKRLESSYPCLYSSDEESD